MILLFYELSVFRLCWSYLQRNERKQLANYQKKKICYWFVAYAQLVGDNSNKGEKLLLMSFQILKIIL